MLGPTYGSPEKMQEEMLKSVYQDRPISPTSVHMDPTTHQNLLKFQDKLQSAKPSMQSVPSGTKTPRIGQNPQNTQPELPGMFSSPEVNFKPSLVENPEGLPVNTPKRAFDLGFECGYKLAGVAASQPEQSTATSPTAMTLTGQAAPQQQQAPAPTGPNAQQRYHDQLRKIVAKSQLDKAKQGLKTKFNMQNAALDYKGNMMQEQDKLQTQGAI